VWSARKADDLVTLATTDPAEFPPEVLRAAELAVERKAHDVLVLDLRGISSATDFFLIAGGTSDVHTRAIAEHIVVELKKDDVRPEHVEGLQGGRWVLVDYVDFVVHVFHPQARQFYQLENLWGDAPRWEAPSD
jgi:ribosome-associated protein